MWNSDVLNWYITLKCIICENLSDNWISTLTHSLPAALDQLRVIASSTSNDPGPRTGQHQQIGQCLLPLVAANFFVDDPVGASSQRREECWCGLLLIVAVPAKQVCSPVGDRCDQIMNDVWLFRCLIDYCVGYFVIHSKLKFGLFRRVISCHDRSVQNG